MAISIEDFKKRIRHYCLTKLRLHRNFMLQWGADYTEHVKVLDEEIKKSLAGERGCSDGE